MLLTELTTYLNAEGVAISGVNLFYGPMKETYPDAVTILQEYGGGKDEPDLGDSNADPTLAAGRSTRLEFPRVQVLSRGVRDDYDGPRAVAETIRTTLAKVLNQQLSGVQYVSIDILQPPFALGGVDANFRERIVFNIQITKEPS